MQLFIDYNSKIINFELVKKASLKHSYITIKNDGRVIVKTNHSLSEKNIKNMVFEKALWILNKQSALQKRVKIADDEILYLGKNYKLETLVKDADAIDCFYAKKAREIISPMVQTWSEKMQLYPTYVGFRKNKTLWGSCSAKNRLSFNTSLAKVPITCIEYVVVHELAHIKHKNHSAKFWNFVGEYLPDFKQRKKGLKGLYLY
jgi:hypothetical protein